MAYIIGKSLEDQMIDAISDPQAWITRNPAYKPVFEDNRRAQMNHQEAGTTLHTPEWKHVARLQSTLEDAIRITKDGGFIKDKNYFYKWLDRNPGYCMYDRRRGRRG